MTSTYLTRREPGSWQRFAGISIEEAARRVAGVVRRTRLVPVPAGVLGAPELDGRVELRLKLENEQETGSFKARGAWNQLSLLEPERRARGVVCTSSGNHGRALAWAARRAGVPATIVMPRDAYANKIEACRAEGAEVVLCDDRAAAEACCAELVERGAALVHPYDAERTLQGAGTVGLEIAEDWPEVEVVVVPVGGGGLLSGTSLALRARLGEDVRVVGAEPAGAPTLTRGLEAREPVVLDAITTRVQGLCPLHAGAVNVAVCATTVDRVVSLDDPTILAMQAHLVRAGHRVEPAGAAATACALTALPAEWLASRGADDPLRVVAVVSGGNADAEQLASLERAS